MAKINTPSEELSEPGLFALGICWATPEAVEVLGASGGDWQRAAARLLDRHRGGDWGDGDKQDNEDALGVGTRLFSSYETPAGRLHVITEADRELTQVLRQEEYRWFRRKRCAGSSPSARRAGRGA